MTDSDNKENRLPLTEGTVKKGGVNPQPTSSRPEPPAGQGGSGQEGSSSSGETNQSE